MQRMTEPSSLEEVAHGALGQGATDFVEQCVRDVVDRVPFREVALRPLCR